jgi:hypothetical protein
MSPITRISFSLPARDHTRINIYNSTGQKVTELLNEEMEMGFHTISFDASGLPFGIYFCQLHSGKFIEARKMLYAGVTK